MGFSFDIGLRTLNIGQICGFVRSLDRKNKDTGSRVLEARKTRKRVSKSSALSQELEYRIPARS
jgi:hypothetical protein